MKLFYYDAKHECVLAELALGNINEKELDLVNRVIGFLSGDEVDFGMADPPLDGRYRAAVVANSWKHEMDDGEPFLVFE